ncbi:hypothetical protein AA101099_1136 [Neoasaia chiangmaiensis NBRC 101099]|nr:hypothetical protein AA101099_1136 [Neoasaia chiangmaiensis NBRC 101099]GEN15947.1 hypothetical protein NCH01_23780 [Neoasaia chiangmaiensis]
MMIEVRPETVAQSDTLNITLRTLLNYMRPETSFRIECSFSGTRIVMRVEPA